MPSPIFRAIALLAQAGEPLPKGGILQLDKTMLVKIAIQWFNVLLLTAVLVYVLYNPVKKFMAARAGRIAASAEAAERDTRAAQELKESYEHLMANIEHEREEILSQTHRAAAQKAERLLEAARAEADGLIQKAEAAIRDERQRQADDIKRQIVELSVLMAERFIEVSIDAQTQQKYIDQALAEWSGPAWKA